MCRRPTPTAWGDRPLLPPRWASELLFLWFHLCLEYSPLPLSLSSPSTHSLLFVHWPSSYRKPSSPLLVHTALYPTRLCDGWIHIYLPTCQVYELPGATVTNDHRVSGRKQQKCILPQFWSQKSEIEVSAGQRSLRKPRGRTFPSPLQLRVLLGLWLRPSRLCLSSHARPSLP